MCLENELRCRSGPGCVSEVLCERVMRVSPLSMTASKELLVIGNRVTSPTNHSGPVAFVEIMLGDTSRKRACWCYSYGTVRRSSDLLLFDGD